MIFGLNLNLLWIIVTLCILYFLYDYFYRIEWSSRATQEYGSYAPADRYPEVVDEFGQPDMIDRSAGGGAIWFDGALKSRNKPWEMVMILDEAIPHNQPVKHADFLYTWVKLNIPNETVLHDVLRLSDSISYDPLKRWLQIRCNFMGANLATAVLAIRIVQGKLTLDQIQKGGLYGQMVFRTVKQHATYDSEAKAEYENEIRQYVQSL